MVGSGATALQLVRCACSALCRAQCQTTLAGCHPGSVASGLLHGAPVSLLQVPELAKEAKHVNVIQRSPSWMLEKHDYEYSAFARWAFKHVPFVRVLYRASLFWMQEVLFPLIFCWDFTAKQVAKTGLAVSRR